jgi:hypothetical protein
MSDLKSNPVCGSRQMNYPIGQGYGAKMNQTVHQDQDAVDVCVCFDCHHAGLMATHPEHCAGS